MSTSSRNATPSTSQAATPGTTDNDSDSDQGNRSDVQSIMSPKNSLDEIDERSVVERQLFDAIEEEDEAKLVQLITEHKNENIDVNHKDLHGHDMLTHAVITGNKAIIKIVWDINTEEVHLKEALLHAIKEGKLKVVENLLVYDDARGNGSWYATLLDMLAKEEKRGQASRRGSILSNKGPLDDSEYGNDITPMIMAASHGHYEIMQLLYNRGERLPRFHSPTCDCVDCKGATRDLERTKRRINLLKAKANPNYLIFRAGLDGDFDPVYKSFLRVEKIREVSKMEPEHEKEYTKIADELEKFPHKLLDLCRTAEETQTFLKQKDKFVGPQKMPFPRLAQALVMKQKELVAHPNVQFLLQAQFNGTVWTTPQTTWNKIGQVAMTILTAVFFFVFQPILWLALGCCKDQKPVQWYSSPRMRAWSKFASHLCFCVILFIMNGDERAEAELEPPSQVLRWVVVVYVISLSLQLFHRKRLFPGGFIGSGWNWFDSITLGLFWICFGLWGHMFWRKSQLEFEEVVHRKTLKPYDPILIEEALFAIASVFTTLKLLRWFILIKLFGPLQSGFYRMARDQKCFLALIVWIVFTFYFSNDILIRPYANLTKFDEKEVKMKDQPDDISSWRKLLVHWFVGEIGPDNVEIFKVNRSFTNPYTGKQDVVEHEHVSTQYFATFMCGVWNVVGIAFLKDAITGQFGASGAAVFEAKDIEWKYDRAKEMLCYIMERSLAPPFNLLPTIRCFKDCGRFLCARKGGDEPEAGCDCYQCCWLKDDVESANEMEHKAKYPILLRTLFQRWFKKNDEDDDDKPTKGSVNEVQEKVKELSELVESVTELLERLKAEKNGRGRHNNGHGGRGDGPDSGGNKKVKRGLSNTSKTSSRTEGTPHPVTPPNQTRRTSQNTTPLGSQTPPKAPVPASNSLLIGTKEKGISDSKSMFQRSKSRTP